LQSFIKNPSQLETVWRFSASILLVAVIRFRLVP